MKQRIKLLLISILIAQGFQLQAFDKKYPISEIGEDLKKNMYAVIRDEESVFKIMEINKSSWHYRRAITILNANGKNYATEVINYDKLSKVVQFDGAVYDANGNLIKKLKKSDVGDQSSVSDFSLFEDDRVKFADLSQTNYPYTVEFEYEVQMNYLFFIPDFMLYRDDEVSAQKRLFKIVYKKGLPPRYKLYKIEGPIQEADQDGYESISWKFENIIPSKWEALSPTTRSYVPNIKVSVDEFEHSGYRGRLNSWDNYGKWQLLLNQNRDALPEATKAQIIELTKSKNGIEEKVKAVYEYVQSKTRYVSIQLGIGGWQPFEAKVVDQYGYGDCKALSNYTVSLLKTIGVKAHYVIIGAGENFEPLDPEFPNNYFNHIVVAVPNQQDTIWLECTSQTKPFGYAGTFTGNRQALMVTDNGGQIVRTPYFKVEDNLQTRTVQVNLEKTGDAQANSSTRFTGLEYENGRLDHWITLGPEKQKEWIQKNTRIPNFDLLNFKMTNVKTRNPCAIVSANYSLRKFATVNGKRIFLTPNIMNRSSNIPSKIENRKTDVLIWSGYIHLDTVLFNIPEDIYPEFVPEPISIKSLFGEYEAQFKMDQNKLMYIRKMKLKDGTYPPESYNELIEFRKNVSKADNTKVVFMSKT